MWERKRGEEGSGMKTMQPQRRETVRGSIHLIAALITQKSFWFEKEDGREKENGKEREKELERKKGIE